MVDERITILGIAGSLRTGSYNRTLLRIASQLVPSGHRLEMFELDGISLYNQDHEQDPPPRVRELKTKVLAADAVLIVTPEYNYSVPGVLKNAIDWASRPYGSNAWDGKPLGIMGASVGMLGSGRAQYHLRQMCVFLNMHPMNDPEVMVPNVAEKFDVAGNLTDEATRKRVQAFLEALVDWTRRFKKA